MRKLIVIIVILTTFVSRLGISATEEAQSKELTLEAAFKKASTAAAKWNKKARLVKATSADSIDGSINETGIEGKRRYWNFTFGIPGKEQVALIRIHDEELEIVDNLHGGVEEKQLIENKEVKLSSREAFKMSIGLVNLKPGVIWAKGYHYILQKQDNEVVLSVIGLDEKGYFSRVSFDAKSKDLISAEHKIPIGGGIFKDNKEEVIKDHKGVSGIGLSLSPNAINDKKQIAYYYSDPYSANMKQVIMKSVDGGKEWREIDFSEELSRIEFSRSYTYDNVIYFITPNKIFKTTDYGCTFNLVFEDNENPIISSTYINNKLYVLTQSYLKVSSDYGGSWDNYDVLQGSSEVLVNSQGSVFIVANNNVYQQRDKAWDKLNIEGDEPISSAIVINDNIIIARNKDLIIYNSRFSKYFISKMNEEIKKLYYISISGTEGIFYSKGDTNSLTRFEFNENTSKLSYEKLNVNFEGQISEVQEDAEGNKYYCMSSGNIWVKMEVKND